MARMTARNDEVGGFEGWIRVGVGAGKKHSLADRKVYAEVPPRTKYAINEPGEQAIPMIEALR